MKKTTFRIRTYEGELKTKEGYSFELSGFKFAVHKPTDNICVWIVIELTSGAQFYHGKQGETRTACIQGTQARIKKYGVLDCQTRIDIYINEHGPANI